MKSVEGLKIGQKLKAGEVFAQIGDTGYCPSGAHLHWDMFLSGDDLSDLRAINVIDPTEYLEENGYPCNTIITNPFGSNKCNPKLIGHEGIDFSSYILRQ